MTDYDALCERLKRDDVGSGLAAAAAIRELRVENGQLRELLDLYNLGGWMDSERLIKERDALRAKVEWLLIDNEWLTRLAKISQHQFESIVNQYAAQCAEIEQLREQLRWLVWREKP